MIPVGAELPGTNKIMSKKITVCFADIPIEIESKSEFMANFCRDYICDKAPLFSVCTDDEAVNKEIKNYIGNTTYSYAEAICLYREIAERLPLFNAAVFHGAAIEYEGKAYLFTAPSGTGKSTHISLWRKYLGEKVKIINGDKPIIKYVNGGLYVYGTPYAGKEGWQKNTMAPLAGICVLSQGNENIANKAKNGIFIKLLCQTYKPHGKEAAENTLQLVQKLCGLPCFTLSCDISENAVKASFTALTNKKYGEQNNEN